MMRSVFLRSSIRLAASRQHAAAAPRCFSTTALKDSYEFVKVETRKDLGVGLITLDRPKALNALCDALFDDLIHAATALDEDDDIGCLVLTGSQKAFAAGADISEMKDRTFEFAYKNVSDIQDLNVVSFVFFPMV